MNASKIEQTIEDIYKYLETCKPARIYANKVLVDKDELMDLLEELRLSAPDEIRRYQKVITNRDDILNDAQKRAETMLSQAQAKTNQLLDESEIMQAAYTRAEEIMRQANEEATALLDQAARESDDMRKSALSYTNDLLSDARLNIQQGLKDAEAAYQRYHDALKTSINIIEGNQNELMGQLGGNAAKPQSAPEPEKIELEPVQKAPETLELDEDDFIKEDM
ncbi:MAG TPA: hypothetical protein DCP06_02020 [Lachnospiraceae bacterium]|nr:hypothetical protein [Lachnospiraceae bacterium]